MDIASRGDVQRAVMMKLDVHHMRKALMKNRSLVRATVAIGVLEDQDPIGCRPVVIIGTEVRMAFGHEDSTITGYGQARGRHDVWILGKQFDRKPLVASLRRIG